jgi:transcriptional regulator with XRE-family HTH domain
MALVDRLQRVLELRNISAHELSKSAGLSSSQVRLWIDRRSERVSPDVLRRVASAANVSARWLLTGEGSPDGDDDAGSWSSGDADGTQPAPASSSDELGPREPLPPGCLGDSPTYPARKKTARRLAPDVPDEWVWDDLKTVDTLFLGTREPSPQVLADLARIIQKHGKPR